MFSKLILENFKAFNHFELNLMETESLKKVKKLAMIYGENSIGKTSIIDAFSLLSNTFHAMRKISSLKDIITKNTMPFNGSLESFLNDFRVDALISELRKVGNTDLMVTHYEGYLMGSKEKFVYEMKFDSNLIVFEKLLINNNIVFKFDKKNNALFISRDHIISEIVYDSILEALKVYFGNFTFLSCLDSVAFKNVANASYHHAFSQQLVNFMSMIEMMMVKTADDFSWSPKERISTFAVNVVNGILRSKDDELRLQRTEQALSMYFGSLYSNIKGVEYKITSDENGTRSYSLYFKEKNESGILIVPYHMVSTGTKKMVDLFVYLYSACINNVIVVIDEIDTGINDLLLKYIFDGISSDVAGQLILTTHNTLLLKSSLKKNIYLLDRNGTFGVYAYSLDEFGRKIQEKTDIIGQYINGLYGGVPQCGSFSMKLISEAIRSHGK